MSRIFVLFFIVSVGSVAFAQEISPVFKAGLNFSTIDGPSEVDDNGRELEDYNMASGFHIGAGIKLALLENFGLRAEAMYSQKGGDYTYDGQSYWVFFTESGDEIYATGTRRTVLSITNSYIDLPVLAYGRFGRVEVSAGVNFAVLVGSRGSGELTFSGRSAGGTEVDPFTIALDFNYASDILQSTDFDEVEVRSIDNQEVEIPKTVGARYGAFGRNDNLFRGVDFGLNAGLAFFLNEGLFLGFRFNYGLSNETKKDQDTAKARLGPDNSFLLRDDLDRNISLQASIGFSF